VAVDIFSIDFAVNTVFGRSSNPSICRHGCDIFPGYVAELVTMFYFELRGCVEFALWIFCISRFYVQALPFFVLIRSLLRIRVVALRNTMPLSAPLRVPCHVFSPDYVIVCNVIIVFAIS